MLPKSLRISRAEFKLLNRPYKSISGKFFSARVYQTGGNVSKFAFSISKKQEKKAVLRNKMRRIAYQAVQDRLSVIKNGFVFYFFLNQKPKVLKDDITIDLNDILLKNNYLHPAL